MGTISKKYDTHNLGLSVRIFLFTMFEFKELSLMFFDPIDILVFNINKLLYSNNAIKIIFS